MKRVASLYLPDWPIERIVRTERAGRIAAPPEGVPGDTRALAEIAAQEQAGRGVPRGDGWRPGARWARAEDAADGRRSGHSGDTAEHSFKAMPPDDGGTVAQDARVAPSIVMPAIVTPDVFRHPAIPSHSSL